MTKKKKRDYSVLTGGGEKNKRRIKTKITNDTLAIFYAHAPLIIKKKRGIICDNKKPF